MRLLVLLVLATLTAGSPLAQTDSLRLGPFADSMEVPVPRWEHLAVRSLWPDEQGLGDVQRLTRVRHSPAFGPTKVLTIAERAYGTRIQITVLGRELSAFPEGDSRSAVRRQRTVTYLADSLYEGIARGLNALREGARRIETYEVPFGLDGETFSVAMWERGRGSQTWSQWTPTHASAQDRVADLVEGILVAAFVESGIFVEDGDPYPNDGLRVTAQRLHREAIGTEPGEITSALTIPLVAALADQVQKVVSRVRVDRGQPSRVDSLFAEALDSSFRAQADTVRRYLALGANPNTVVAYSVWETPGAAPIDRVNSLDALRLLLGAGADREGSGLSGTPLARFARNQNLSGMEALLRAGADPNGRDHYGYPPLVAAFAGLNVGDARDLTEEERFTRLLPVLKALLDGGADPNAREGSGGTIMHSLYMHRAMEGESVELKNAIRWMIARGADPDLRDYYGRTPREAEIELREGLREFERMRQQSEK